MLFDNLLYFPFFRETNSIVFFLDFKWFIFKIQVGYGPTTGLAYNFETGSYFEKILPNTEYTILKKQAQYRVLILFLFWLTCKALFIKTS